MEDKEQRIRRRAYEPWYLRGCPHDSDQDHWHQAWQEIEGRTGTHLPSDLQRDEPKENLAEQDDPGNSENKGWWNGAVWRAPG